MRLLLAVLAALAIAFPAAAQPLIPTSTYALPNGLTVVFHVDRSDPVVAVVLAAKVGSARETPGRTGFAHLFEHLFFLDSENLGPGGLDKMSARIGGSGANGATSRDWTVYLQTVPKDALEKMIWAEADKLGYFINTVTPAVLAKEKQVVKNEKRQSYDTRPYGQTEIVIGEALYPKDHPYHWPVIGSLADVRGFYGRWYTPRNAVLTIAGDFDPAQARAFVAKYFGEIPAGAAPPPVRPRPAKLARTVSLVHEDSLATLPELTLAFPAVEETHKDRAALEVLMTLLTDGKEAPLNAVIVDEKQLAPEVSAALQSSQIAGEAYFTVRAFEGVDLDQVQAALDEGFRRFEAKGVDPAELQRIKTMAEANFFAGLGSVLDKGEAVARHVVTTGQPGYADVELSRLRAVTAADVMRVYRQYIKGRPHVATSFVPGGKAELALAGAAKAAVTVEPIVQGAEAEVDPTVSRSAIARTPSSFDRSQEPPAGAAPVVAPPTIWTAALANGLAVSGIENDELPLVDFQIAFDGGRLYDDIGKPGATALLARMLDRGTKTKTPAELENAFKALGATISVSAGDERTILSGRTLSRNIDATLALVAEMLMEPRWDATELALAKSAQVADIQDARSQPAAIAGRLVDIATFGTDHILSRSSLGTEASVAALTMDDLKAHMARTLTPANARLRLVGAVSQGQATKAAGALAAWTGASAPLPAWPAPAAPASARVLFYDVPGATQSVLAFTAPGPRRADADYYPANVMNYILGGGGFASRLTQQLRESKGYTYGVRSAFVGGKGYGQFALSSQVRANVTLEAAQLARQIMTDYAATFTPADLEVTKAALTKSRARAFETAGAKLRVLEAIGDYGLPADYLKTEEAVIEGMTVERVRALAAKWLRPGAMTYVVVGDAATQEGRLGALEAGPVVRVNEVLAGVDR